MKLRLPLILSLAACADLGVVEPDVCGNNVVEAPREDCDLVVDPELGEDLTCGAPGFFGACRYLCGGGASCPDGWACFEDRICRPPSGAFEFDDEPVRILRADDFVVANFLGGPEAELAVRLDGDLSVWSLGEDDEAPVRFLATFDAARGGIGSVPIDDDRSALVVPSVSLDAGQPARAVVHVLEEERARLVSAAAARTTLPLSAGDTLLAVRAIRLDDDDGLDDRLVLIERDGTARVAFDTPGCIAPFANTSTVGPAGSPIDFASLRLATGARRVAIAFEDSVALGTTAVAAGGCLALTRVVRLPASAPVQSIDFVRSPDGDDEEDLVVALADQTVAVARGPAFDTLAIDDHYDPLDELADNQSRECSGERFILATAHLQREEGPADVVTEDAIYFATPSGFVRVYTRARGDGWAEAVIGDFDRDGLNDVVVSTRSARAGCDVVDVRLLRQVAPGAFTSAPVPNVSLPRDLHVGDFDGDGVDDVVLVERSRDEEDAVTVLFGAARAPLEDAATVTSFESIATIEATVTRAGSGLNVDRNADVLVVHDEDAPLVTVLLGTSRRSLLSPIPLGSGGHRPFAVASGRLYDGDAETPDLVALDGERVAFVAGDDLDFGGPVETTTVALEGFRTECAIVGIAKAGTGGAFVGIDGAGGCEGPAKLLYLARDEDGAYAAATAEAPPGRPTQLELGDLDDDGVDDWVIHFATEDGKGSVFVFWNARIEDDALVFARPPERVLGALIVRSAALIDVDDDVPPEIAVYTANGLFTIDYDEDDVALYASPSPLTMPLDYEDDGDAHLRAGRVGPDALADLVLLLGQGVFVFETVPRR